MKNNIRSMLVMAAIILVVFVIVKENRDREILEEVYPDYQWTVPQINVESDGKGIAVSWKPIKDETSFDSYELYSADKADGEYTLEQTIPVSDNLKEGKYIYNGKLGNGIRWYKMRAVSKEGHGSFGSVMPIVQTTGKIVQKTDVGKKWLIQVEMTNLSGIELWMFADPLDSELATAVGAKSNNDDEESDLFDTELCDADGSKSLSFVKLNSSTEPQPVYFLVKGWGLGKYDFEACYTDLRTIKLDYIEPVSEDAPDDQGRFTINISKNPDRYYCGANWYLDEMREEGSE